jgi:hypothetical protein
MMWYNNDGRLGLGEVICIESEQLLRLCDVRRGTCITRGKKEGALETTTFTEKYAATFFEQSEDNFVRKEKISSRVSV